MAYSVIRPLLGQGSEGSDSDHIRWAQVRFPYGTRVFAAGLSDAYAHCKFIGYTSAAAELFEAAGLPGPAGLDDGFLSLDEYPAAEFVARCRQLRFWERQRVAVA